MLSNAFVLKHFIILRKFPATLKMFTMYFCLILLSAFFFIQCEKSIFLDNKLFNMKPNSLN